MNGKRLVLKVLWGWAAAVLASCVGSPVLAESLCGELTESNRLGDGRPYASVSLSYIYSGGKRGVRIAVEENDEILLPRKYAGIRRFGFNTAIERPGINLEIKVPREWRRRYKRCDYGAYGRFEVNVGRRIPSLGKPYKQVTPLVMDVYYRGGDLSYDDIMVPNRQKRFFAALMANFTHDGRYYPGACFAARGKPGRCMESTTTTTIEPCTTTTIESTTTSTGGPSSSTTTSIKPVTSTTAMTMTTSTSSAGPVTTTIPTTSSAISSSTSTQVTTTSVAAPACRGEIYKGGLCDLGVPIDDPAYNRPGRRGLALTCEEVVDFCVCTDCANRDPACLVWTIEPAEPYLGIMANANGTARLTVGDACGQLEEIRTYTVR